MLFCVVLCFVVLCCVVLCCVALFVYWFDRVSYPAALDVILYQCFVLLRYNISNFLNQVVGGYLPYI